MSKVDGIGSLLEKLDRLGISAEEGLSKAIGKQTKKVQATAKLLCSVNQGELRNNIKTRVETEAGRVIGTVYTKKKHAAYVEFGTGPVGEQNHAGISPAITPAYSQNPWWIHESMIDKKDAEQYHFFKIETANGTFYQTHGQPAQPFLYPALKSNEKNIRSSVEEELQKQIRKVTKNG